MRITNVRVHQFEGEGKIKAYGTVVFDGALTVTDLKVVAGSKGLFVSMPSRKNKDGQYKDIVYPCTAEMREAIQKAVLGAYRAVAGNKADELEAQAEQSREQDLGLEGDAPVPAEADLGGEPELAAVGGAAF